MRQSCVALLNWATVGHHDARISQVARDVNAGQDMLVDLFERIGRSFTRLETYTERSPSEGMTSMMMEVTAETLSVLATVTVEIKQSRRSWSSSPAVILVLYSRFPRKMFQEATR